MKKVKTTLILGIGNILLKDEGVGVHVAQQMMKMPLPENVEVIDGGTAGLDLLLYIKGRTKIIVIDCVRGGKKPGIIYRLVPEDLVKDESKILSLHQVDFHETLNLLSMTTAIMPEVIIIGIEPKEHSSWKMELSPLIKRKIPKIIELVKKEI
ncbi:MAG: HyaD/HybD family hydrogenase maturation endopeptidase [bacterium]|nr:HyaD/HybD family hydrogenase maturation endopeptidase [bacterium]